MEWVEMEWVEMGCGGGSPTLTMSEVSPRVRTVAPRPSTAYHLLPALRGQQAAGRGGSTQPRDREISQRSRGGWRRARVGSNHCAPVGVVGANHDYFRGERRDGESYEGDRGEDGISGDGGSGGGGSVAQGSWVVAVQVVEAGTVEKVLLTPAVVAEESRESR